MKKTVYIIHTIYALCIIILFILFFSRNTKDKQTEQVEATDTGKFDRTVFEAGENTTKIAFVNTDSILSNYEYYKQAIDKFEKQKVRAESQFQQKYQKLEEDYKNYVTKVQLGLMTEAEAEAQFSKQQREVESYYNKLTSDLMKREEELAAQLYDSIISQVEQYNKRLGFNYIIAHSKGSNILFADPELDLTDEILTELNTSYYKWIGENKSKNKKSK